MNCLKKKEIKRLIFWQNIISPHQLDLLRAVSKKYEVTLIVDQVQDDYRKKYGWEIPDTGFVNLIIAPSESILKTLFKDENTVHVFSGISAYKTVYKGFKTAIKLNAKIGIFSEPIDMHGLRGFLKLIRGKLQRIRFGNKIHFIAATGKLGVDTYLKFGYNRNIIFHWGYFVDIQLHPLQEKKNEISFVGNLNTNKQIKFLLEILSQNDFCGFNKINVIGNGELENELHQLFENDKRVNFLGRLTNKETMKMISISKLLVIPSLSDGWAVVVNEALLCGTSVIASNQVGANILLDNKNRGEIFKAGDANHLKKLLIKWSNLKLNECDYQEIQKWAFQNITPTVAANYFGEILDYVFCENPNKPKAPWL